MSFRIAHISDLHLPPMPAVGLNEVLNKRLLGYFSWHRKRKHRHRVEVVAALESDLRERRADHICITGDITNIGLPEEFRAARLWLDRLSRREAVTLVPGNHDTYVAASLDAMRQHLEGWLPDAFPAVIRRGDVMFIGVSTAVATPPLFATGRIGAEQLQRLAALLDETAEEGLYRILLIHHPPASGVVGGRKSLTDAAALERLLRGRAVDLVLHGHGHRPAHYELRSGTGPIPVFGAGSASLAHGDAALTGHYHLFELDEHRLAVTHYHYRPGERRFVATAEASLPRRGATGGETG